MRSHMYISLPCISYMLEIFPRVEFSLVDRCNQITEKGCCESP